MLCNFLFSLCGLVCMYGRLFPSSARRAVQDKIHIYTVDQPVSAKAATKYVHRKRTEHSSCPTSYSWAIVPGIYVNNMCQL